MNKIINHLHSHTVKYRALILIGFIVLYAAFIFAAMDLAFPPITQ